MNVDLNEIINRLDQERRLQLMVLDEIHQHGNPFSVSRIEELYRAIDLMGTEQYETIRDRLKERKV